MNMNKKYYIGADKDIYIEFEAPDDNEAKIKAIERFKVHKPIMVKYLSTYGYTDTIFVGHKDLDIIIDNLKAHPNYQSIKSVVDLKTNKHIKFYESKSKY